MNTLEAYQATLNKVEELKKEGCEIKFFPYDRKKHSEEYVNKLIKEYPDLPIEKWTSVQITFGNRIQFEKIKDAINYLSLIGIRFDRGGAGDNFDWELDWSFDYNEEERGDEIEATNTLFESIEENNSKEE